MLVALLAAGRFSVVGLRTDLLLAAGFLIGSLSTAAFAIVPMLGGGSLDPADAWAALLGSIAAQGLVAVAPFVGGRSRVRERAIRDAVIAAAIALVAAWLVLRAHGSALPALTSLPGGADAPPGLASALAVQALICLLAVVGWGRRFARTGDDLARWLALGFTLQLFAALHLVFTPPRDTTYVAVGDFLRLLAFAVMLVGAWRAIRSAELGRAVAEERARVAREIHDGLAQYLFAVSTHAQMLEAGTPVEEVGPQLKQAAALAQQEARFAILALSSASGTAPFDSALRRYVEFLTADGGLEVDLEIDPAIRLAPDEQIEIFRIVQEGLGNVRRHANARRAEVVIGQRPSGERFVAIEDDGDGLPPSGNGRAGVAEHARPGVVHRRRHHRPQHPRPRYGARGRLANVIAFPSAGLLECSAVGRVLGLIDRRRTLLRVASRRPRRRKRPLQHVTIFGDSVAAALTWDSTARRVLARDDRLSLELSRVRPPDAAGLSLAAPAQRPQEGGVVGAQGRPDAVVLVGYNDDPHVYAAGIGGVLKAMQRRGVKHVLWLTLRAVDKQFRRSTR